MKTQRKLISIFIVIAVLISMIGVTGTVPASAQSSVGYVITGYGEGSDFTLDVSIQGINALAGRIAISFDAEKLELKDDSDLTNAVIKASGIVITPEGLDSSVLLSNSKGYAMFAWYPSSNAGLDATNEAKLVASIPLRIKDGYTTDDFSRNTFGIRYVNSSMVDKWDCGATLIEKGLNKYSNMSLNDDYLCNITYDYPNCDYIPIVTYEASISVSDLYGSPISGAAVSIDNLKETTDSSGTASFQLENGIYGYRVQSLGYQTETGYITVSDGNASKTVMLRSYAQMVQATANELEIEFSAGDDAANVTTGIGLATSGANGESITWESSDPSVVTTQGIVIRQDRDVNVTLTATVSMGTATTKRTFYITVRSKDTTEQTNEAIVQMDAAELAIGYAPGDSVNAVTSDINLPEVGSYGSSIIWSSSNLSIIDEYGMVIRPATDTNVTLTATVIRGSVNVKKTFTVTVKAEAAVSIKSDAELVNEVITALQIGYADGDNASSVTKPMTLPVNGADGVVITWRSSQPAIVTAYGGVVRQFGDCEVTLTASAAKGSAVLEKVFKVVVKAAEVPPVNPDMDDTGETEKIENNDAECVTNDKNSLKIIYAPGDSAGSVTADITLPATGENGSSIFWESSDTSVISAYGSVSRPSTDANVRLTAIISKGSASDTKTFSLTVKGKAAEVTISDEDIVREVANALEILYTAGDSAGRVTKSVTLPTTGANDTTITWKSSNPNVIGTNGGVTRKTINMPVTLTAVVTRGSASAEKVFELTVIAAEQMTGSSVVNGDGTIEIVYPTQAPTATEVPSSQVSERFTDLGTVPWAKEAILELAKVGVIKGTSETEYSPDASISRGDYITLLVRMLKLDGELGEGFADVPETSYYYEPITVAKTLGVITGIGDNRFDPEGSISRQDMMTMTYRALSKLGMADYEKSDLSGFNDTAEVADYALESVSYMVGGGLIAGDENGNLNPNDNTTRAETAVFLYRLYLKK